MLRQLSYVIDGRLGERLPEQIDSTVKLIEDGVDYVVGQGNGMDAGPYYLGSETIMPLRRSGAEPIFLAAKRTETPFVFSLGGGAGADLHLKSYLDDLGAIARDNGTKFRVAVISS